jgi:hypothetical protein
MSNEHPHDKIAEAGYVDTEKETVPTTRGVDQVVRDETIAREQGVKPAFIAKVGFYPVSRDCAVETEFNASFLQVAVLNRAITQCGMGRYQVC